MRKLVAIAICAIPLAVVPTVYAQSSTDKGPKTSAPSTSPTPNESMGGTSASSGKHGTAGATMGEGMKSHAKEKSGAADSASDSTEASKKIGGEPVDTAPKEATPPGTSANDRNADKKGTGSK